MNIFSIFKKKSDKSIVDEFTELAIKFAKQDRFSMVNFTTDKDVEVKVEKATKIKQLINEMCNEWSMQLQWALDEKGIKDVKHIGLDTYGNIVYSIDDEIDQKTLEFEPDVWVHKD